MSACAFSNGFDSGFEICAPVVVADEPKGWGPYIPRKTIILIKPIRLAGETYGETYTEPAKIIVHPRVGAGASASAYTDEALALVWTNEPAQARMLARLTVQAFDQGECSASVTLVDEDVEALLLMGVI